MKDYGRGFPQCGQNFAFGSTGAPQFGQKGPVVVVVEVDGVVEGAGGAV